MKFSHKLMIEATMFYENNVLEGPKQMDRKVIFVFQCLKMHSMIKIATKRIGMEDFCGKKSEKDLVFGTLKVYNLLLF